jgi:hypothetical protein
MMIRDPDLIRPLKEMTSPTADYISRQDNKRLLVKKFISKYLAKPAQYYRPGMELSSPMGKRLLESFSLGLGLSSVKELRKIVRSYERYCGANSMTHKQLLASLKGQHSSKVKIDLISLPSPDKNNCLTSRLLRSQQMINPASNAWGLKSYHIYTFSKQDRMEKMKTMETGLDWKGRLVAMHCDSFSLDAKKEVICESCNQEINGDDGHNCLSNDVVLEESEEVTEVVSLPNPPPQDEAQEDCSISSRTATASRINVVVPSIKVVTITENQPPPLVAGKTTSNKSNSTARSGHELPKPPPLISAPSTRSRERLLQQQKKTHNSLF